MIWSGKSRVNKVTVIYPVLCLLVTAMASCVTTTVKEDDYLNLPPKQEFYGLKRRIAVIDFENKSDYTGADVGRGLTDMLITELNKSGKFIIVERDELEAVLTEEAYAKTGEFSRHGSGQLKELDESESIQNLGVSGYLTTEAIIRIGDILKVDAIATGGVAEFGPSEVVGFFVTTHFRVGLDMHLVDARKGDIMSAEHVVKVSEQRLNREFMESVDFHKDEFTHGIMGITARKAVGYLVDKTVHAMTGMPWKGHIIRVESGDIYVNAGREAGLKEGDRLLAYREGEKLIDPLTGAIFDIDETELGLLEVVSLEDSFSICHGAKGLKTNDVVRLEREVTQWRE